MEGFSRRHLDVRGSGVSGTAYLNFDECRTPQDSLIGKAGNGFKMIMYNFNHERFYVTAIAARLSRICLEESIRYALKRKTFGKTLSESQAIRMKIASMARRVESLYSWLESLTYQLCTMSHQEANQKIGDIMCLCKAESSKVYELCSRETTMIFGGNALYTKGVGQKIEPASIQVSSSFTLFFPPGFLKSLLFRSNLTKFLLVLKILWMTLEQGLPLNWQKILLGCEQILTVFATENKVLPIFEIWPKLFSTQFSTPIRSSHVFGASGQF